MAHYNVEDVKGAHTDNGLVCAGCLTEEELSELEQGSLILTEHVEDDEHYYYCDRCNKMLS